MALTPHGVYYQAATDEFAPSTHDKAQADSLGPRVIATVANTTERDALATTVSPSSSAPLIVFRADAPPGKQIEYTADGIDWYPEADDSGWLNMTSIGANFTQIETLRVRQIGDRIDLVGVLQNTTDSGSYVVAGVLPAGIDPPTSEWAITIATGSTAAIRGGYVTPAGELRIYSSSPSSAYLRVSGTWLRS